MPRIPPGDRAERLDGVPQRDECTGSWLSDMRDMNNPSPPHWDPEGETPDPRSDQVSKWWLTTGKGVTPERYAELPRTNMYDRMNPLGGRELRNLLHGKPDSWCAPSTAGNETFRQVWIHPYLSPSLRLFLSTGPPATSD